MRECLKCHVTKAVSEFYKDKSRKDGVHPYCKTCRIAHACTWGKANRHRTIEYTRKYKRRHAVQIKESNRVYALKNKKKIDARLILNVAVRTWAVVRPQNCERCGRQAKVHGHHDDYDRPLEVEWLCASCHMSHHAAVGGG
jgi:hypothetical protein